MSQEDSKKIVEHLDSLSGINSSDYLAQLKKSISEQVDDSSTLRYRASQVGENSVFIVDNDMADNSLLHSSHVDITYDHKKYLDINDENKNPFPNVTDKFRAMAGLFWTDKATQSTPSYSQGESTTRSELIYLAKDIASLTDTHLPLKMHFNSLMLPQSVPEGVKEWVLLEGRPNFSGRGEDNSAYMTATKFHKRIIDAFDNTRRLNNGSQFDHTMSVMQFTKKEDVERESSSVFHRYADIHGDYNYFDGIYETTIANSIVGETTIPNMYVFFAYQDSENPNPAFEYHLTQNGKLNLASHQDLLNGVTTNTQLRARPTEKYFYQWSSAYLDSFEDSTTLTMDSKFKNLIFSADDVKTLMGYERHKEMFPMWMHIEFTTDILTEFAETLKDSKLMGILQQELVTALKDDLIPRAEFFEARKVENSAITADNIASSEAKGQMQFVFKTQSKRRVFDLTSWMNSFLNDSVGDASNVSSGTVDSIISTFLGTYNINEVVSNDPKYKFYKSLLSVILKGKFRKLLKKHTRTFQQIMMGQACHHETVMYRISKYRVGEGAGTQSETLIQTFLVPNSNELDVFRYIDTQVKYQDAYTYTISAFELVVGNEYKYDELIHNNSHGKWAAVSVINKPSLRLVEVPLYKYTNRVMDNPPIHPEVEFIPFKGINNRIKIIMNSGIGRYELPSEIIESEEQQQVDKLKLSQNKEIEDREMRYETDDHPVFYEIFRLKEKPKSFADFSGSKIHNVSTLLGDEIKPMRASGVSTIDKIKPNTKYYYCVRSIDNHGHISYPSPIYEVEMVDDGGAVYPIVRLCEFAPQIESQPSLGGKRYIHIQPTMPQMIVNEEASGIIDTASVKEIQQLTLGISEEALWGKKFKIRLTSKSTGKKIDFNVSFNHKHLKLSNGD